MKDEIMRYDFVSYECTDPDSLQFCKKEGSRVWWYFQVIDDTLLGRYKGDAKRFISDYNRDEHINGISIRKTVDGTSSVAATISLDEYSNDEIEQCLHQFGYSMQGDCRFVNIKENSDDNYEQLCCEFLFEEMIPELLNNGL